MIILFLFLMYFLLFMLGASVFSFVNVVAYRLPLKLNYVTGHSMCTECGKQLKGVHLIPVFSYVFLKGKCAYCAKKIEPRYLIVEIIGGFLSVLTFSIYCLNGNEFDIYSFLRFALCFFFISVLAVITIIDNETMEIPNGLCIWLLALAVPFYILFPEITLLQRLIGLACVSVPMLIISCIINGAFGGGDIKLMGAVGLILGWKLTLLAMFIAIIIGGGYAIVGLVLKKIDKKAQIPFGPYLCLGIVVSLFFGNEIITWYTGLIV